MRGSGLCRLLRGNVTRDEVIRVAAEPQEVFFGLRSRIGPGVLFLREFREFLLEFCTELARRISFRAGILHGGKRLQAHIRSRIEVAFNRDYLARSSKRIGDSLRTELFFRKDKCRNHERNPHRFSHRVSAHHGKRLVLGTNRPEIARRMLFQIGIERRVPIRRKRARPVHGVIRIHFRRQVIIEHLGGLPMRCKLQLSVEHAASRPRSRRNFGPPLHGTIAHRHAPEAAHRLESAEHIGFIPLDGLNRIEDLRKRIITRLRVENLRKRFPRQRLAARNNRGFGFRNRLEHRERIFGQFRTSHHTLVIFRLFILARKANRIIVIGGKIKRCKRRLVDHAHLLVRILTYSISEFHLNHTHGRSNRWQRRHTRRHFR